MFFVRPAHPGQQSTCNLRHIGKSFQHDGIPVSRWPTSHLTTRRISLFNFNTKTMQLLKIKFMTIFYHFQRECNHYDAISIPFSYDLVCNISIATKSDHVERWRSTWVYSDILIMPNTLCVRYPLFFLRYF